VQLTVSPSRVDTETPNYVGVDVTHPIPPPPGGPTPTSWADHQALFLAFISKAWPPKCKLAKNTKRCEIA